MLRTGMLLLWGGSALLVACSSGNDDVGGGALGPGGATGQGANGSNGSGGMPAQTTNSGGNGNGGGTPVAEVKVAFIGDSGNGTPFSDVLDLVLAEQVDAVIHNGDFDYELDPDGFFATVDGKLGADFPYFASVGNHDAPAWDEYALGLQVHLDANAVQLDDPDVLDQKWAYHYLGLHFVFVGENGNNDEFAQFIDDQFEPDEPNWKICGWHKNQRAMQIGGKSDEMGWDVYEMCRVHGAIITTGHEHSYERTKTLIDMTNQVVDPSCPDADAVCVSPGRTIAIVSGLAGVGIRDQERCLPETPPYGCNGEWASIYAEQQGANYGALFIVFNAGGDPKRASGYFKDVDGAVVDEFEITRD